MANFSFMVALNKITQWQNFLHCGQECTFDITVTHVFAIFCQSPFKVFWCLQLHKCLSTRPSLFGEGKTHPVDFPYNVTIWKLTKKMAIVSLFLQTQNATKDVFSLSVCIPEKKEATSSCVHDQGKPRIRTTYPSSLWDMFTWSGLYLKNKLV